MRHGKRILVIDGHPDPDSSRLVHALCERYAAGALQSGHFAQVIRIAELTFPFLATRADLTTARPLPQFQHILESLVRCDHVVMVFPVWLGSMPAKLQGFLEHLMRQVAGFSPGPQVDRTHNVLRGKSGRLIMTMTMPVEASLSLSDFRLRTSALANYLGLNPLHSTVFGEIDLAKERRRRAMLEYVARLGRRAI